MSEKKQKSKARERIFTVLFMLGVTFVFFSIVYVVHLTTRETIRINETIAFKKSVLYAAGIIKDKNMPSRKVDKIFADRIEEIRKESVYAVKDTDAGYTGWIIKTSGEGLWGEIEAVVGLHSDLETLTGVDFIKLNETPGLGARITEKWFREQFRGKTGPLSAVPEKSKAGEKEFDAITGATFTVRGVKDMLNRTFKNAPDVTRKKKTAQE